MSGPRHLLAVSWDMPPLSGPRAVQVARTVKHLVPLGWHSTVVCFGARSARYFPDPDLAARLRLPDEVRLVPVRSPEERFVFRALWRVFPPVKMLPDEKWVWIRPALRAARRLAGTTRFDALVTFAQPWSDHLIGLRLRRETGLPWLAHFSDPWVDSPLVDGAPWQRRIWAGMERDVVREADGLVFVNEQTADLTMRKYPAEWRAKVHVVPHGYDREMLPAAPPSAGIDGCAPLRIVYTGRFYRGRRTPEPLLRAVARLTSGHDTPPVLVTFVGTADEEYLRLRTALGIERAVEFRGRLSWADSISLAARADVLLVVDAPAETSVFLPSKLIDYLPLRKPILGLTPAHGATADLLGALGYPAVPSDDVAAIEDALADLVAAHRSGRLGPSAQHDAVSGRYDIRHTTAAFARAIDCACRETEVS